MSLTDGDPQWFKSRVGIDRSWAPRIDSPCAEVAERGAALVIPDVLAHPRYRDTGFAASGLRFYAGAPLVTEQGHGLGSLCVLGTEARVSAVADLAMLDDLAAMVMTQIERRSAFGRVDRLTGLPNRTQFFEDMEGLARHASEGDGERYLFLIHIARGEQLNKAVRVMGPFYFDDFVISAAQKITGGDRPRPPRLPRRADADRVRRWSSSIAGRLPRAFGVRARAVAQRDRVPFRDYDNDRGRAVQTA